MLIGVYNLALYIWDSNNQMKLGKNKLVISTSISLCEMVRPLRAESGGHILELLKGVEKNISVYI